jgi:membrane protease YdiL (CAAX protease family)
VGGGGVESQREVWPGPVGRPARPHWWSAQEPPPASRSCPISARRAYAEVLLVFAAFFAASIVAGGETLARRYPAPSGSWAVFTPAILSQLGTCVLAVLVTVLLSGRRGISARWLGFSWPRARDGRPGVAQSLRIGVWAISALLAGGAITGVLAMGNKLGQPAHQDASYRIYTVAASLTAGIVEETVVLAFVVTTLRQARRPLPEIVLVAVLLRCSYHDYYGLGFLGIAVWAAIFVWLFLRTGSVLPLIVVHVLWDTTVFLGQHWHVLQIAGANIWLLLLLAAGISWLVDLHARRASPPGGQPPGGPPPGVHELGAAVSAAAPGHENATDTDGPDSEKDARL